MSTYLNDIVTFYMFTKVRSLEYQKMVYFKANKWAFINKSVFHLKNELKTLEKLSEKSFEDN